MLQSQPQPASAGPSDMSAATAQRVMAFTRSELFERTFREGMDMVEEVAAYLDGPGRMDAKRLSREDALTYASQSMQLTTRLMQVASWLLVQRSLESGEMQLEDARRPKYRLVGEVEGEPGALSFSDLARNARALPAPLLDLLARSNALYGRLLRLDRSLYLDEAPETQGVSVGEQMARLHLAFSQDDG